MTIVFAIAIAFLVVFVPPLVFVLWCDAVDQREARRGEVKK